MRALVFVVREPNNKRQAIYIEHTAREALLKARSLFNRLRPQLSTLSPSLVVEAHDFEAAADHDFRFPIATVRHVP